MNSMAKMFARYAAAAVVLCGTPLAEEQCSLGACTEEPSDYASAMQKRSQVVASQERVANTAAITEEMLSQKGGGNKGGEGGDEVDKSTNEKGGSQRRRRRTQRRRRTIKTTLEDRARQLEAKLSDLIETADGAHQQVRDAFNAKVVKGVDSLRNAAMAADKAMLATHAELVETLDKLEIQWEDKVYTLTVAAAEAQQKILDAAQDITEDARAELERKKEEAQNALAAAEASWRLWQEKYQTVQSDMKDQLDHFAQLLEKQAEIVEDKYEVLLIAAAEARQRAEDAIDVALDASTQALIDAAVQAEERRVEMLAHYRDIVFDLQTKVSEFQAHLDELDQKGRELKARAESWVQKFRETGETVAVSVREAQEEFVEQITARAKEVEEKVTEKVKDTLGFLREIVQQIDNKVQNTVHTAVQLIQSQFDVFAAALKSVQDELKQTVTAELQQREREMKAAVAKAEASLKEAVTDLEDLVVAKVEAMVAEADAALRKAKANVDAAVESAKKVAEDLKAQAQKTVEDLRKLETAAKQAQEQISLSLQKAKSDAEKIQEELKDIVGDVVDSAIESANKAVSAVNDLFNAFRR